MEILAAILFLLFVVMAIAAVTIIVLIALGVKMVVGPFVREGSLAAVLVIGALLLVFVWRHERQSAVATPAMVATEQAPPAAVDPRPADLPKRPDALVDVKTDEPETPAVTSSPSAEQPASDSDAVEIFEFIGPKSVRIAKTLPDWARTADDPQVTKTGERITLVSRRYSTINEAEAELQSRIQPALAAWLSDGRWQPPARSLSSADLVNSGLITRRVQERFDVHVGAFTESVYRISWQVDWNPEARAALTAKWLPKLQFQRIQYLVTLLLILTLLFRIWSGVLRANETRLAKYRGLLTIGASVMTVLCIAALARSAGQFLGT